MDEKTFWDIISLACQPGADTDAWHQGLVAQLQKLPPDEIIAFDRLFDQKTDALYSVDLWGAAYIINGGASDDGFYYFQCWLVGMGKQVYEAALANPDSLAEVVNPDEVYEAEIYSVGHSACNALGLDDEAYEAACAKAGKRSHPKLKGRRWNYDNDTQVRKRFPRLAAIYLEEDEDDE